MSTKANKYTDLLRYSPIGCLLLEDQEIVAVNPQAVEALEIPSGKLIGVPLPELLLPEFEATCIALIAQANDKSEQLAVRLARAVAPIELMARRIKGSLVIVGVRSLDHDHYYSAVAKGDLTHDQVTGLPNRYYILSELHRYLVNGNVRPLSVVALWIDELNELAESHGERVVERIISEVGDRLQLRLRGPDMLGRFDETGFLTILRSDISADQLTEIGDRLRDEVAFPVQFDNKLVSFTTSIAMGSIVDNRPSVSRILALLEAAGNRAVTSGGVRTEILKF